MRASCGLFVILLITSAWFHQGGGWKQNVRFAQIRAISEAGTLAVDDYLYYQLRRGADGEVDYRRATLSSDGSSRLVRPPEIGG